MMLYQALLRRNRWETLYITWYSTCQNLPRSTTYCPCLKLTDTASSLAGGIEANNTLSTDQDELGFAYRYRSIPQKSGSDVREA